MRLQEELTETLAGDPVQYAHCLWNAMMTGAWLTVQPSTVNGMELGAQEFQDDVFQKNGLEPPELPKFCNGCNAAFCICHAIERKKVNLSTARHNKLRDGVADLSDNAFNPMHVSDPPSHIRSLRRAESRNTSKRVHNNTIKKEARGHRTEGQPSDP